MCRRMDIQRCQKKKEIVNQVKKTKLDTVVSRINQILCVRKIINRSSTLSRWLPDRIESKIINFVLQSVFTHHNYCSVLEVILLSQYFFNSSTHQFLPKLDHCFILMSVIIHNCPVSQFEIIPIPFMFFQFLIFDTFVHSENEST